MTRIRVYELDKSIRLTLDEQNQAAATLNGGVIQTHHDLTREVYRELLRAKVEVSFLECWIKSWLKQLGGV